ncbi:MAG: polyphosphate kinase 1 [Chitinophagaceae bacterium]|nr:polyphosphate kinase 1 [Chitinophagaceae bacterium]
MHKHFISRDISWLSFNARVLQEAADETVPLKQRIRFLGIFSNNTDEFFRVRVATLKRMIEYTQINKSLNMHLEESPQKIVDEIQVIVLQQQSEFNRIWKGILAELKRNKIFLKNEANLNKEQAVFVKKFFDEKVRGHVIPLMIEGLTQMPYLREKSIFLGVTMRKQTTAYHQKYALIEVPVKYVGRFVQLPSKTGEKNIILLEDIIRFNLPHIFTYFDYDVFESWIFKVTKDAEIDLDSDINTSFVEKMEKGIKNRRKGKTVRFVYDKEMDAGLLQFLIRKLDLNKKSNIIPGGRIHNYRHFMDFPDVFKTRNKTQSPIYHPAFLQNKRIDEVIVQQDVMLHFPYHSFEHIIDVLREAAMDEKVISIKITAYRLAQNSKIINALINAARNGKKVLVMLELKARFDEEANIEWKSILEEEGVKVVIGVPRMKVHAKICVIQKKEKNKIVQYGFVSTGNLNEKTAKVYSDNCLLTANPKVMADINKIFHYLENWKTKESLLKQCKTLLICPTNMRQKIYALIDKEIKTAKNKKAASIIIKCNSLSDKILIEKLRDAAEAGVEIKLIIRGIYCATFSNKKTKIPVKAISIVDEYLEHGRIMVFGEGKKAKVFISSGDWMVRNLDHRIEAAVEIINSAIKKEIQDILQIQLNDNVKARVLNTSLSNEYVRNQLRKKYRSQVETYKYLLNKVVSFK